MLPGAVGGVFLFAGVFLCGVAAAGVWVRVELVVAGYGLEGAGDDAADVIGHDILPEAAFCAGVDYHLLFPMAHLTFLLYIFMPGLAI